MNKGKPERISSESTGSQGGGVEKLWVLHEENHRFFFLNDMDAICRESVLLAAEKLDFGRAGLWLYHADTESFSGTYGVDETGDLRDEREIIRPALNVKRDYLQIQKIHPGVRTERNGKLHNHRYEEIAEGATIAVPLAVGKDFYGVLFMDDYLRSETYNDEDIELARILGSTIAHHLSRVAQSSALQESQASLRQFADRLRKLQKVSDRLALIHTVDELCRQAVRAAHENLGYSRLSIWFSDPEPDFIQGSWGISEKGVLRDERHSRHRARA